MLLEPVASLPMYDWPEVQWATDALWTAVANHLIAAGLEAPPALDRERDSEAVWTDPNLVLSQTCGWPYATRLSDSVRLVGTPIYGGAGCPGPTYNSVIVARAGEAGNSLADFAGRRIAINGRDSLSGYVMLVAAMRDAGMPVPTTRSWIETGSHRQSVRAVADGRADIAAIDAVCWALAERHDPGVLRRLRIIERTALRPALPFITAVTRSEADVALIRSAILHAIGSQATRSAADALFLTNVEVLGPQAYAPIADLLGTTHTIPGDASRASRG